MALTYEGYNWPTDPHRDPKPLLNMRLPLLITILVLSIASQAAMAQTVEIDRAKQFFDQQVDELPLRLPKVDLYQELLADEKRASLDQVAHYAAVLEVDVDPWQVGIGSWEGLGSDRARWQLRIHSPGALSLSLAFTDFELPKGARLNITSADGEVLAGPFTAADNEDHHQLWTPPVTTDEILVSVELPLKALNDLRLHLTRVHHGYAGFGQPSREKSGSCQRDLVCADNDAWNQLGRSVGLVSVQGVRYCTGFLINNTAHDQKPLFITAGHCGIDEKTAASVVVMWEHALEECDASAEAPMPSRSFQTGAILRASHRASDLVLIELDDAPNTESGAYFAGWDRSFDEPRKALTIHHPNTDRRRIAVTESRVQSTEHLGSRSVDRGDHFRVRSWDSGTTEGGSSGAPLFNEDLRVVGALHGGHAACGNRQSDWFGRLSAAWDDGNTPARRFREWLDPEGTGAVVLDGLSP